MTQTGRILISGAGIAGLTLAVLLKEQGHDPLVVECDDALPTEGYMMDFFGTGWDVAERMGLTDGLRTLRYPIEALQFVDERGKVYASVPISRVSRALGGKYVYLRRPDLVRILHERAQSLGVEIQFGTEIAQIEGASGLEPMVRCWMHTGFLNMKGEKMSKSLGNFVTIRNALDRLDYRILRFYFLRTHYRSAAEMTDDGIDQARQTLERLQNFVRNLERERDDADSSPAIDEFRSAFQHSLDDDFNTPKALGLLFDFIRDRNRAGSAGRRVFQLLQEVDGLFDVLDFETDAEDDEIQQQVDLRQRLRAEKKFAEADQIRDRLLEEGIVIEDSAAGPRWHRK